MTVTATKSSHLKILTSRCYEPYRAYSISFNSANVSNFLEWIPEEWIEVEEKKKKEKRKFLSCVHVVHKTWDWSFSRRSCAVTAKKCTKKRDAPAELFFGQSKPVAFLSFSLTSPCSLLFGGHWSKSLHWCSYAQMTNAKASFIELSMYIYPDLWKRA